MPSADRKTTEGRQLVNKRQQFSGQDAHKDNRKPLSSLNLRRNAAADKRQAAFIFNSKRDTILKMEVQPISLQAVAFACVAGHRSQVKKVH